MNEKQNKELGELFYKNKEKIAIIFIDYDSHDGNATKLLEIKFDKKDEDLLKDPEKLLKIYLRRLHKEHNKDIDPGEYRMYAEDNRGNSITGIGMMYACVKVYSKNLLII